MGDFSGRWSGSGDRRWLLVMGDRERCNSSMVGGLWWTASADGLEGLCTKLSVEKKNPQNADYLYCDQDIERIADSLQMFFMLPTDAQRSIA